MIHTTHPHVHKQGSVASSAALRQLVRQCDMTVNRKLEGYGGLLNEVSVLESTKFQRVGIWRTLLLVPSCLWTTVTLMKVNLQRIFWLELTLFRHPIHSTVMDIMTWTLEGDCSHWSHSVEWRPLSVGCFLKVSLGENFYPNVQMKSAFDKLQLNSSKLVIFSPERRMSRSDDSIKQKKSSQSKSSQRIIAKCSAAIWLLLSATKWISWKSEISQDKDRRADCTWTRSRKSAHYFFSYIK